MKLYSELEVAYVENATADPTTFLNHGRLIWRTDTQELRLYNKATASWEIIFGSINLKGQETVDLLDEDLTVPSGRTYHHPNLILATTRTGTVNGTLSYHCKLTLNGTAVLTVPSGGLVCP